MSISSIRFNSSQMHLQDYSLIKVAGADRESFFQGQVTNDLSSLPINEGQLTARLNRLGKLQSFFFIAKLNECLFLLCPKILVESIKMDFEKFIIMDDVVLESVDSDLWIIFNHFLEDTQTKEPFFDFNFYGINARLVLEQHPTLNQTDESELEEIRILNGWPKWGADVDETQFINDSYLNEIAISYKKGCFLGQETAAKIENNRGAAYYPVLLKLDPPVVLGQFLKADFQINLEEGERKAGTFLYQVKDMFQALLFRDFRVVGRELELLFGSKKIKVTVMNLPFYKNFSKAEMALELYHLGVENFQSNNLADALECLKRALSFDPSFADAYESLGVMLGREEKFQEAIEWMDKLLIVSPQSVMAHTNKSLYLMRLGKIEEAEAEKSLATVKSFAVFGQEAKLKKQLAEDLKKKEEEVFRREKMFLQVLEIDEEDTIALYGMGDIFFQRKDFQSAIKNLEKVIVVDSKYSTAYLLLGKAYEAEGDIEKARSVYQAGIILASKRGDMMPANEMQSRLNQLVVSPGLS
ncbi:MAG: tetratricopeptide repeat protein [Bacteriovorax sp.]|nr:tetratricopeptide repeat protein [Bacteriovorax sp.]